MKKQLLFQLAFAVIFVQGIRSQNLKEVERDICRQYKSAGTDSLLRKTILNYTSTVPATLSYPFDSLKLLNKLPKGGIYTSDDGAFRIYSVKGDNIIQYLTGSKVSARLLKPLNSKAGKNYNFREVYTIKSGAQTWYLGIYETEEGEGIKFFALNNNGLNDTVKLIKTPTGIHNELTYFAYDFKDNPNRFIYYDATTSTIYIPLVNSNYLFTNKTIAYHFTGQYFEKTEQ